MVGGLPQRTNTHNKAEPAASAAFEFYEEEMVN